MYIFIQFYFVDIVKRMKTYIYLFAILISSFITYWFLKDKFFYNPEGFEHPAKASVEIRQAPIYPERTITSSGPNPPNQIADPSEIVIHGDPAPKDPYSESNESSKIPENLRHPERSFRPPPMNDNTQLAIEAGIASKHQQNSPQNLQKFSTEFIQGGGEFMEGVFANDTMSTTNFSAF